MCLFCAQSNAFEWMTQFVFILQFLPFLASSNFITSQHITNLVFFVIIFGCHSSSFFILPIIFILTHAYVVDVIWVTWDCEEVLPLFLSMEPHSRQWGAMQATIIMCCYCYVCCRERSIHSNNLFKQSQTKYATLSMFRHLTTTSKLIAMHSTATVFDSIKFFGAVIARVRETQIDTDRKRSEQR